MRDEIISHTHKDTQNGNGSFRRVRFSGNAHWETRETYRRNLYTVVIVVVVVVVFIVVFVTVVSRRYQHVVVVG